MGQLKHLVVIALLAFGVNSFAQVSSPAPAASASAPVASAPVVAAPAASAPPAIVLPTSVVSPTSSDFSALLQGLGGLKGAGALALVLFIVQGLVFFFRSQLAAFAGVYQLLIINGLTLIGGILALKVQGMDWLAAIMNSQVLAAAQVYVHQVITQVKKVPADQAAIAASPAPASPSTPAAS